VEWRYDNASDMRNIFTRVRDEIFCLYAVPVLVNHDDLVKLANSRCIELENTWQKEVAGHNESVYRGKAQMALTSSEYGNYIDFMEQIPGSNQSPLERARIAYVKRKFLDK
jgi:hypothetical protein